MQLETRTLERQLHEDIDDKRTLKDILHKVLQRPSGIAPPAIMMFMHSLNRPQKDSVSLYKIPHNTVVVWGRLFVEQNMPVLVCLKLISIVP